MLAARTNSRSWYLILAAVLLALPACESDGHFCILGYSSRPNYDTSIKTVRVAIFGNETYRQRLEFDLTEAVIREIHTRTPYRVVPAHAPADTELVGRIVAAQKNLINFNQLGEVRDADTTLTVEVSWRDLRPGRIGADFVPPIDPSIQPELPPPPVAPKVLVQSLGSFRPELGESRASAEELMVRNMARQIVELMERPW